MSQDIIEKKPSSPLATSLLAISALCLIGAITFNILELRELKHDDHILDAGKVYSAKMLAPHVKVKE
ncbi:MAG: hypothetical protein L0Z55_10270 [Planctomycetes bacterium]|nr:hypothetical protein [Planctomycetota bacterium]